MASTPPTYEPSAFRAGDSVRWTRTLADYPAGTWTLAYTLNGPTLITITASADGTDHAVSVLPAVSAVYKPGVYTWAARVTDGTDTYTVGTGTLEILANPAKASTTDARSHARRFLDAIESVLEGRATHDVASYTIGGRQLARVSLEELLAARGKYRAEVRAEENADRLARGLPSRRHIGVKF